MNNTRARLALVVLTPAVMLSCSGTPDSAEVDPSADAAQRAELRTLVAELELQPLQPATGEDPLKVNLGRELFFDPLLSGNRDTACATCHDPRMGSTDGSSLATGTKAELEDGRRVPGLGHSFTPRNARDLFNKGEPSVSAMLWDNRLEVSDDGTFVLHDFQWSHVPGSYVRELSSGLENLVAAQALFPVLDRDEMRGESNEFDIFGEPNELGNKSDVDLEGTWKAIATRIVGVDEYARQLAQIYPDVPKEELDFLHATNAISAFITASFTFAESPWDSFVSGDDDALSDAAVRGALLFYGKADCGTCHGGTLQTDHQLHNVGIRPMTAGPDIHKDLDYGAALRSHVGPEGRFAFRTPSLRNVALSGPWMHNGAYTTLEGTVRQMLAPRESLWEYDAAQLEPQFRTQVHNNEAFLEEVEESLDPRFEEPIRLTDDEVADVVAFLEALTAPAAAEMEHLIPDSVPSGLDLVLTEPH